MQACVHNPTHARIHANAFIAFHNSTSNADTNIDDDIISASDAIDRSHQLLSGV